MQTQAPNPRELITFERAYPGTIDQARRVRADLAEASADADFPAVDELLLLASDWQPTRSCTANPDDQNGTSPFDWCSGRVTTHGLRSSIWV